MFDQKGYVAGAVFLPDHTVAHVVTSNPEMLQALRSSKYLQSYTGALYGDVKKLLEEGRGVFYCGAPCQIAGLYRFLRKDYQQLVTCDFVCLGVGSPKVFLSYVHMLERQYGSRVKGVKFKDKTYGWHRFSTRIAFENGETYVKDRYADLFMRGYLKYKGFVRPSCYTCGFKKTPRQADITLADFWGIDQLHPELDDDSGTSAVLLNSAKGQSYFRSAGAYLTVRESSVQAVAVGNTALTQSIASANGRDCFFQDLNRMPFEELAEKHFPLDSIATRIRRNLRRRVMGVLKFLKRTRLTGQ